MNELQHMLMKVNLSEIKQQYKFTHSSSNDFERVRQHFDKYACQE